MITAAQLRAVNRLTPFTDEDIEVLLGAATARRFAPGEALCLQGRPATSCFILVSGVVEVEKESGGRVRVLTRLGAGNIAGQLALVDRTPRIATLRAQTEVIALELSRDVFERLVNASSPLAYRFQFEIAVATGRQLREADLRLAAILEARTKRLTPTPDLAANFAAAERRAFRRLQDSVEDLDVPVDHSDVIEITSLDDFDDDDQRR